MFAACGVWSVCLREAVSRGSLAGCQLLQSPREGGASLQAQPPSGLVGPENPRALQDASVRAPQDKPPMPMWRWEGGCGDILVGDSTKFKEVPAFPPLEYKDNGNSSH